MLASVFALMGLAFAAEPLWSPVGVNKDSVWSYRGATVPNAQGAFTFEFRIDYRPGAILYGEKDENLSTSLIKVKAFCETKQIVYVEDTHYDEHGKVIVKNSMVDLPARTVTPQSMIGATLYSICNKKGKPT